MLKRVLTPLAVVLAVGMASSSAWSQPKDIKWGTGPVGGTGQRALVVLANLLNKKMPELRISVLPHPGAVATVKGVALGGLDGYYGSDVALREYAADAERFKDFRKHVKVTPTQSFWCYTLDVGVAIKATDMGSIKTWSDLTGKNVYTGPLPFDTRRHLENALRAAGVKHVYRQVDLKTAGSQLNSGSIKAMIIYAAGGKTPPSWIAEASLAVDWEALNPSKKEVATLKAAGFAVGEVPAKNFHKDDAKVKSIALIPMYWGFSLGIGNSEEQVYKVLKVIEKNADELAKTDPSFAQIGGGKMAAFQKQALESTWKLVPIHPGLAKYLKEKKMWDSAWDSNVAKTKS